MVIEVSDYSKSFQFVYRLFPKWVRWTHALAPEHRRRKSISYPMGEVVLLGICLFLFRYRSLKSFVREFRHNSVGIANLNEFFTLSEVPSDDEFRYILSEIPTAFFNRMLKHLHQRLEGKKVIQNWRLLGKYDLVSIDGSGQLSSYKIKCKKCLSRTNKSGHVMHLHGQLLASLISTNPPASLALAFEPIENAGERTEYEKNDCEINAAKRLLRKMKVTYPKRPFCILGDNLFAVLPIAKQIQSNGWNFILTAKPERNQELFSWHDSMSDHKKQYQFTDNNGGKHFYEWVNGLPLRQEDSGKNYFFVNLLEYTEMGENGQVLYYNSWVTDILLHERNVKEIARGGRARFNIENSSFNEQKTRGYHTEHNFGHFGNLPNVFFGLAQIAHLFSEAFSLWKEGKRLTQEVGSKRRFWERMATLYSSVAVPTHELPILYLKFTSDSS